MILVFGKNGQIGGEINNFDNVINLSRCEANLLNPKACQEAILKYKPTAVINAAAYTSVDKAEEEELVANIINSDAPELMAETCKKMQIPFIHISSDYVFNGSGCNKQKTNNKTAPINAYGRSKLKGEKAIIKSEANFAIIRTSWVFSNHGKNFLKSILNLAQLKESLNVVADQFGGPTPAYDIAKASLIAAKELMINPNKKGIYHFCGYPTVSWYQFAKEIIKLSKLKSTISPITTSQFETIAKRPLNSRLDCEKIKTVFGISQPNWKIGLKEILKEEKYLS